MKRTCTVHIGSACALSSAQTVKVQSAAVWICWCSDACNTHHNGSNGEAGNSSESCTQPVSRFLIVCWLQCVHHSCRSSACTPQQSLSEQHTGSRVCSEILMSDRLYTGRCSLVRQQLCNRQNLMCAVSAELRTCKAAIASIRGSVDVSNVAIGPGLLDSKWAHQQRCARLQLACLCASST